jgi:hypothetical protein
VPLKTKNRIGTNLLDLLPNPYKDHPVILLRKMPPLHRRGISTIPLLWRGRGWFFAQKGNMIKVMQQV